MSSTEQTTTDGMNDQPPNQPMQTTKEPKTTTTQAVNIVDAVRNYLKTNKLKIIVGTPCYGGNLHNGYFNSMINLVKYFTLLDIKYEIVTIGNESLIPRARNGIVAKFMADTDATHLMFIDADITFQWENIVQLILHDKDLSGGCYPKKMINWDKVRHNIVTNPKIDDNLLIAKSVDYVFNPIYNKVVGDNGEVKLTSQIQNGLISVKDIGTGFMLIKKSVIEIMMYKYDNFKYVNNVAGYSSGNDSKIKEYFYTLFDTEIDPISKVYLSEDYLFCKRWIECGGECWLDLSCNLNHTGSMDYKGAVSLSIGELDVMNKDFKMMNTK